MRAELPRVEPRFVVTRGQARGVEARLQHRTRILRSGTAEAADGAPRIDLSFDLRVATMPPAAARAPVSLRRCRRVAPVRGAPGRRAAAGRAAVRRAGAPSGLAETGSPSPLRDWCARGTPFTWAWCCRHHEFGISANAMTVFDVPRPRPTRWARVAAQPGVTLCYRRAKRARLAVLAVLHGADREREAVRPLIDDAAHAPPDSGRSASGDAVQHAPLQTDRRALLAGARASVSAARPPRTRSGAAGRRARCDRRAADPPAARRSFDSGRAAVRRHRRRTRTSTSPT